ncbi:15217_t:CDS:2 [Gigaspora margarita]|uniref:15217_t:CDS:1 n=1 Tax=Gigaspora margarita TaxID=4874 RepID=A0ABN7W3X6_GIGMA|nr:15217_t:CDS:2 [Gigaspora margarita]
MPYPKPKSRIASSKPRTKICTFTIQFQVSKNINEFVKAPNDWELFEVTDEDFQNYALKAIEWHQEADKKIKSAFYTKAKNIKTLNEMWDTQQKQLIKEHYNELKKQFRGLQNTKNQIAKSQPYDIASRGEKKWKRQKRLQKFFEKASGILNTWPAISEDGQKIILFKAPYLVVIFNSSKRSFPLALKNELEETIFPKLLGIYFNGHERDDIKKYHIEWELRIVNYRKRIEDYSGDEMEIIILSEQQDSRHMYNKSFIKKKGQGSAIIVSDFICACHGPLHLTEANAEQLGLDRDARVIIKPEHQSNGY